MDNNGIVVVSDVHLGIRKHNETDRDQFKDLLQDIGEGEKDPKLRNIDHLVLNGDFEDLWLRNLRTLTRENYDIYSKLAEIRDSGTEVHYIPGNHDWYARRDRAGKMSRFNNRYYDTEHNNHHAKLLTTHNTRYLFMHGHQFDSQMYKWPRFGARLNSKFPGLGARLDNFLNRERGLFDDIRDEIFDWLALILGDATGSKWKNRWGTFTGELGKITEHRWRYVPMLLLRPLTGSGPWWRGESIAEEWDVEGRDLGIAPNPPKGGPSAVSYLKNYQGPPDDPGPADWLCIGHTHTPGILNSQGKNVTEDPRNTKQGIANSGSWMETRRQAESKQDEAEPNTYLFLEERPHIMEWNDGKPTKHHDPQSSSKQSREGRVKTGLKNVINKVKKLF